MFHSDVPVLYWVFLVKFQMSTVIFYNLYALNASNNWIIFQLINVLKIFIKLNPTKYELRRIFCLQIIESCIFSCIIIITMCSHRLCRSCCRAAVALRWDRRTDGTAPQGRAGRGGNSLHSALSTGCSPLSTNKQQQHRLPVSTNNNNNTG